MTIDDETQLEQYLAQKRIQQPVFEQQGDTEALRECLATQGLILKDLGRFDEALMVLEHEQSVCDQAGDKVDLAICIWNQGIIYKLQQHIDQAIHLFEQSIALKRSCGVTVEENEAQLQELKGDLKGNLKGNLKGK